MKKIFVFAILLVVFIVLGLGCSVSRALNQPEKKNMNVLKPGTHRDVVLSELGNPIVSGITEEGHNYDIFSFVQGYSKGTKVARAFGHGVADVFSIGFWEVFANPIEGVASGTKIRIKVFYKEGRIEKVEKIEIPPDK